MRKPVYCSKYPIKGQVVLQYCSKKNANRVILAYSAIRVSISPMRLSNSCRASRTGAGVLMSTPAPFSKATGAVEQPPERKPKLSGTAGAPYFKMRWDRAMAAEKPVAY